MAVTVKWNGITTVEEATETPGDGMSIGEYCDAFADAHGIDPGTHPRFTVDGETLDTDADIGLLDDATVFLTVDVPAPSEGTGADDDQEPPANIDKPLDDMTVKELRAYAKANDITLGEARSKAAIIETITAVVVERTSTVREAPGTGEPMVEVPAEVGGPPVEITGDGSGEKLPPIENATFPAARRDNGADDIV